MDDPRHDDALHVELTHPALSVDTTSLQALVRRVVAGEGRSIADLSIILSDHDHVLSLNRTYLHHDYLTDVLSFDLRESEFDDIEGEVYVDLDTAAERYAEFGASFEDEVARYVVHGVLHLIGYADDTPEGKAQMRALEDRYLASRAA